MILNILCYNIYFSLAKHTYWSCTRFSHFRCSNSKFPVFINILNLACLKKSSYRVPVQKIPVTLAFYEYIFVSNDILYTSHIKVFSSTIVCCVLHSNFKVFHYTIVYSSWFVCSLILFHSSMQYGILFL